MPKKSQPLISVVILNWNRPQDTIKCVESVKKQTYSNIEIIVVENGSSDNSVQVLEKIKNINLVKNPINRGFTGGHIDGLSYAKGEFIFVLNNDAVVDPNYLEKAIDIIEKDVKIAVVGGRSYAWDGSSEELNTSNPFFAFQQINPYTLEGIFKREDNNFNHEVNWVSGSAMLIRKKVLDETGYFYDPMFAYYEESDLFNRIQSKGYSIIYSPSLHIWHKDGGSSTSFFQLNQLFKNRFVYGLRNLEFKEMKPFLNSYLKLTLRGTYHYMFGNKNNEEERDFNKALNRALLFNITALPKTLSSRKEVFNHKADQYSLKNRLLIEKTGVSFVIDSRSVKLTKKFTQSIIDTSYMHYNSEFIFVGKKIELVAVEKFIKDNSLTDYSVRTAPINELISTNPLNIGWLSAKHEYVWFMNDTNSLDNFSGKKLEEILLKVSDKEFVVYGVNSTDQLASRALLSLFGGLRNNNYKNSVTLLVQFASIFKQASTYGDTSTYTLEKPTTEEKNYIHSVIQNYEDKLRRGGVYAKILTRNYRIYQLDNTVRWLFLGNLTLRHKAGRLKSVLLSALKLERKALALELKHINNEVVKQKTNSFDPEERELYHRQKAEAAIVSKEWKKTPIFIICRDRVSPLIELINWLEKNGLYNIILIDNASIYPPLLDFFRKTQYQVIKTEKNIGHTVVWEEGFAKTLFPGEYYIVTDPDVIPDKKCPNDAIEYFYKLHAKYIQYQKVGFGLQIDDLPDYYKLKNTVIDWEKQFWNTPLEDNVFEAGVDTTFALYKPYTDTYILHPSIRTGRPYTARHLPWYVDSSKIDEEEAFYRLHASQNITSWNTDEVLERYKKELNNQI